MKKIKRSVCLIIVLLLIPIMNLLVNAEQAYYQQLSEFWYQGVPLDWTGFIARERVGNSESAYPIEGISSITNSQNEAVALPDNSYGQQEYNTAIKLSFSKSNTDIRISPGSWWNKHPQLDTLIEEGCLRIMVYFDGTAEQAKNMYLYLRNDSYDESSKIKFDDIFTPMQWSESYIPVKSLMTAVFTGGKMKEFRIQTTGAFEGSCDIYIHEIGFARQLKAPELQITEAKMDNVTSKFVLKGEFTKEMYKTGTYAVKKGFFTLNGIAADKITVASDNKSIQIEFDTMPHFPSNVTLSISEGMKSKEGIPFEPTDIEIQTPEFQNEVFSGFYDEPIIVGTDVVYTPFIKFLYSSDNNPQTVTILTLLYNDGILVNSSSIVSAAGQRKDIITPEISISIPEEATGSLSLDAFFIDSMESLKPVCEKSTCETIN